MIILTKYGNVVSITTKDHKVRFFSIKQFLKAFELKKSDMTITMDTDLVDVKNIPIAEWSIAGITGIASVDDLGNAIKALTEIDVQ